MLEPVIAYLMIVKEQYEDSSLQGYYNVGPDKTDCVTTGELVQLLWNARARDSDGSTDKTEGFMGTVS